MTMDDIDNLEDSLPTAGKHPERDDDLFEGKSNVSAPDPYPPVRTTDRGEESESGQADSTRYQLLHHEESGRYHLRTVGEDAKDPTKGYKRIEQFDSRPSIEDFSTGLPGEPQYVVFENSDTGEVFFDMQSNLNDNWTDSDRFDEITIFDSEEEASTYAESRQKKS